ncbi:MAG TPA: glutaredoxin domain-containing protein [Kiritimatiellia bacterium]|nr:glutaredoxin domain-containing protein [Kiritimatiellia bacterium]HMO98523.1 glutaredoxin domain-containing protein [Kiritimatiellia bacterium]HMP95831.1 glutaredoxin domain-containing protein [Kiritimatiellia bacterium]
MPTIEIYYADICGLCHQAMAFFRSRRLSFVAHEVHWDGEKFVDTPTSRDMHRRCGPVDFVPQIFVNGRHIPGWRKLEPMIASGEFDRLLATPPPHARSI